MIYCIEDDKPILDMMVYALNASGFDAMGLQDGMSFWNQLKKELPSLILLDLNLPCEDGISILEKLKQDARTVEIPIIIASARGSEFDKVIGLDKGADDYLVKPFGMMEMISRVKAVLRRCNKNNTVPRILTYGVITINLDDYSIRINDNEIKLTTKEFEILRLMISSDKKVLSREELTRLVWGQENMEESRTIDVHIGTLRQKLGEYGKYIETVRGIGYKINKDA